jgi:hypothetical protein
MSGRLTVKVVALQQSPSLIWLKVDMVAGGPEKDASSRWTKRACLAS